MKDLKIKLAEKQRKAACKNYDSAQPGTAAERTAKQEYYKAHFEVEKLTNKN